MPQTRQETYNVDMKKISLFLAASWLVACAGTPPAWWNPSGRYGQETETPAPVAKKTPAPVATEETMDPLPDNSYEEEALSPLPEEDTPAAPAVVEPSLDNTLPAPSVLE